MGGFQLAAQLANRRLELSDFVAIRGARPRERRFRTGVQTLELVAQGGDRPLELRDLIVRLGDGRSNGLVAARAFVFELLAHGGDLVSHVAQLSLKVEGVGACGISGP
jgi:hypothetical protein